MENTHTHFRFRTRTARVQMFSQCERAAELTVPAGLQFGQQLLCGHQVPILHCLKQLLLLSHNPLLLVHL